MSNGTDIAALYREFTDHDGAHERQPRGRRALPRSRAAGRGEGVQSL